MKNRKFVNLDSEESVFFNRQLEVVKTETYDIEYPALKARQLFPVDMSAGPGAASITYRQYDAVGVAKVIANYATDLPRVDLVGKEFTAKVKSLGDSYGYSIQDIRYARQAGLDLETRKSNAAKKAIMTKENDIAFNGDADNGLVGFLNHPNLTDVAIPQNAGATSTEWADKTPDEILADVNLLVAEVVDATNGVETPNTLLLPHAQFQDISTRRLTDTGITIKQFIMAENEYVKEIIPVYNLKAAGASDTDMMVVYDKSPDAIQLAVPQDFEQFPAQDKGLEFEIPCHSRVGGILFYKPLSAAKGDGI